MSLGPRQTATTADQDSTADEEIAGDNSCRGKIIKGIAGFYYVQTEDKLYECKAKGIFRNKKMKPLVGDNVEIDILDEEDQEGNITKIYERSNELIRPAVANVNQALIIFAAKTQSRTIICWIDS